MIQRLLNPLAIFVFATFLISCRDKGKQTTTVEPEKPSNTFMLLGTWNLLFTAYDDNENGQLDEEEKSFPETDDEKVSILFKSDGTGETIFTFEDTPGVIDEEKEAFKWAFQNNETELLLITEYVDSFGTDLDTTVMTILTLSEVSLALQEYYTYFNGVDSTTDLSWLVMEKIK